MIHSSSIVQYLDIDKDKSFETSIDDLYKKYIENAIQVNSDECISKIDFTNNHNIKISDWYGWSQLLCIKRVKVDKWIELIVNQKQLQYSLILGEGMLVPSYNPYNSSRGFHGEIKYPYELKAVESFTERDILRAWKLVDFKDRSDSTDEAEFWHPTFIYPHKSDNNCGYIIHTKSGFVNVNKFHLYTNDINDDLRKHIK